MSSFICNSNTFKAVAKVMWISSLYNEYGSVQTVDQLNDLVKKLAAMNGEAYMQCYSHHFEEGEDIEIEVELFTDYPSLEIVPQDLQSATCFLYQCSEGSVYCSNFYNEVEKSVESMKQRLNFTKKDYEDCYWG